MDKTKWYSHRRHERGHRLRCACRRVPMDKDELRVAVI